MLKPRDLILAGALLTASSMPACKGKDIPTCSPEVQQNTLKISGAVQGDAFHVLDNGKFEPHSPDSGIKDSDVQNFKGPEQGSFLIAIPGSESIQVFRADTGSSGFMQADEDGVLVTYSFNYGPTQKMQIRPDNDTQEPIEVIVPDNNEPDYTTCKILPNQNPEDEMRKELKAVLDASLKKLPPQ